MRYKKSKFPIRIELIIIIIMVICIMYFSTIDRISRTMDGFTINENGVIHLLQNQKEIDEYKKMKYPIVTYQRYACRTIQIFDSNFNPIINVSLRKDSGNILEVYPEIIELSKNNIKGSKNFKYNGINATIHFEWVTINDKTKYLTLYSISLDDITSNIISDTVWYLIVVLSFVLLVNIIYWQIKSLSNNNVFNFKNTN